MDFCLSMGFHCSFSAFKLHTYIRITDGGIFDRFEMVGIYQTDEGTNRCRQFETVFDINMSVFIDLQL